MSNKIRLTAFLSILMAFMILATSCSGVSGGGGHYTPTTTPTDETTGTDEVDLSALPENLRDNILLGSKGKGSCKELKGNVMITVVVVSEPEHPWTAEAIQNLKVKHTEAATLMKNEAASYGTVLNLFFNYVNATVDYDLSMQNFSLWAPHAMERAGLGSLNTFGLEEGAKYGCESAPVFFYVNRPGRSFAIPGGDTEYACFYEGAEDFRHELNHIFGAADYYFPDSLKAVAERYYPNSIMLGAKEPYVTDNFTAYLMGWTNTLSTSDITFLNEVSLIPTTDFTNPEVSNTLTGYVENHKYGDGYYTGDLIDGVQYGKGKMVYSDGRIYEGDWVYGLYEGNGKITYPGGGYYDGGFLDGNFHGYGTFKWGTGECFKGYWEKGVQHGSGTYYYADGSSFSGTWNNGNFMG